MDVVLFESNQGGEEVAICERAVAEGAARDGATGTDQMPGDASRRQLAFVRPRRDHGMPTNIMYGRRGSFEGESAGEFFTKLSREVGTGDDDRRWLCGRSGEDLARLYHDVDAADQQSRPQPPFHAATEASTLQKP